MRNIKDESVENRLLKHTRTLNTAIDTAVETFHLYNRFNKLFLLISRSTSTYVRFNRLVRIR